PPGLKSRIASLRPSTLEPAYYAIPGIRSRDVSESPRAPHRHIHPRLRGVDGEADGRLPQTAREETPPDGRGCVPVPTRDLLPVGRAMARDLSVACHTTPGRLPDRGRS